ncbi:hypothetical protein ACTQ49_11995 [Luteococcus sp. Sow4_B9]|uniref:hypothetical protein n=1 Tax=Luteococcus sp. Sow4_B9 TaxID=3438792 RepID=UPI003F9CB398
MSGSTRRGRMRSTLRGRIVVVTLVLAGCAALGLVAQRAAPPGQRSPEGAGNSRGQVGAGASAPTPYRPSFQTLDFGDDDGKGSPEVDYSGVDVASQQLALALKSTRFPNHRCVAPVAAPTTFAAIERHSEVYVNCLLDAWRPWLEAHGTEHVKPIDLRHCGLAQWRGTQACSDEHTVTWDPGVGTFYLHRRFGVGLWESSTIAMTLGRMTAATLQHQVRLPEGHWVLLMGVDDDTQVMNRRQSLQVECMASGMLRAAQSPSQAELAEERTVYDRGADYWGAKSQAFWLAQARRGVVGECDAIIAAPALVAHR